MGKLFFCVCFFKVRPVGRGVRELGFVDGKVSRCALLQTEVHCWGWASFGELNFEPEALLFFWGEGKGNFDNIGGLFFFGGYSIFFLDCGWGKSLVLRVGISFSRSEGF